MKKLVWSFLGLLVVIAVSLVGVLLYFNDTRLRAFILPIAKEQLGRNLTIEQIELRLFSTFPNVGLGLLNIVLPEENNRDTLASVAEIQVNVELWPLLENRIEISKLFISEPVFYYKVDQKGQTNLDDIINRFSSSDSTQQATEADSTKKPFGIQLQSFQIEKAKLRYSDDQTGFKITLDDTNLGMQLDFSDVLNTNVDLKIGALSVFERSAVLVNRLALALFQESTFDFKNGRLDIQSGTLEIEGLELNLSGNVQQLNGETPELDLQLTTSAPNLNTLLKLVPEAYATQLKGVETKGELMVSAGIKGPIVTGEIPDFTANVSIKNGWLKYPGYEAISDIQVDFTANNKLVSLSKFQAKAGANVLSISGKMNDILKPDIGFDMNATVSADLSTLKKYYDLTQFDISELRGGLTIKAQAKGISSSIEKTNYTASIQLNNGFVRYNYPGVTKPIENIKLRVDANPKRITIHELKATASNNTLSANGTVDNPLDERLRSIQTKADLRLNLQSIKEFYPLNPDSIQLAGLLTAKVDARGNPSNPERMSISGEVKLSNGSLKLAQLPHPIQQIHLEASGNQNQIRLKQASFKAKSNQLTLNGTVANYLKSEPNYNVNVKGTVLLQEVTDFTGPITGLKKLSGTATANLNVRGSGLEPDFNKIRYEGSVNVAKLQLEHDSLPQPIQQVDVQLVFSEKSVQLKNMFAKTGSTQFTLSGNLANYQTFLDEKAKGTALLNGSFNGKLIQVDEWMDWSVESEERTEPLLIELPKLQAKLQAQAESLVVMGVPMRNLKASTESDQKHVTLNLESVEVFGGKITGAITFSVLRPTRTAIDFKGKIDNVRAENFFKEYKITGKDSKMHEYVNGGLTIDATYSSEIDSLMSPDLRTSQGKGYFGMTKSRLKNHPAQLEIANLTGIKELENIVLDDWTATYEINKGVMKLSNMKLTSGNVGAELNGTHDLVQDKMNFTMNLFLPKSYSAQLAKWITKDAVDALSNKDGTIRIPLRLTGSSSKPVVKTDADAIKKMVADYLAKKAGDQIEGVLKNLFDN